MKFGPWFGGIIASLCVAISASAIVIDGTRDAGYALVSTQTVTTGFGDNVNEWNAAYADVWAGTLNLMFTGNLEANFNKLEIFIDSSSAVTSNVLTTAGNDGAGVMDGMTFDSGFAPDYHLIVRRGFDGVNKFDVDFADLGAGTASGYFDIGAGVNDMFSASTGTGVNLSPIQVGFDNSNMAGIAGCDTANDSPPNCPAADAAAAEAVTTGLELGIELSDLGNPTGPIKVMLLQNNSGHDFLSNQSLGGLPAGTGNLGSGFYGTPVAQTDFNNFAGNQFFVVPEPAAFALLGLGMIGLLARRRR